MSESQLNALAQLGLSVWNQGWTSCLLELGGPPTFAFEVVLPRGVLSTGSGEGCHLVGQGDCSSTGVGGAAEVSCSPTGEVLCSRVSGGNGGVCPNKIRKEAARVTWQTERKSVQLLLSSWMTCSSRSCMMLPCSLWNDSAWRAFWALTSLMALEQLASASWTIWSLVALDFLTTIEQAVLASKITQEQLVLASKVNWEQVVWASRVTWGQVALASLIDSAAWDLLWQRAMISSHMAFYLQTSMNALVVRKSSRALLAFAWSSSSSTRGVMLLVLETAAIGDAGGMSSREASAASVLTWDEVSTGWDGPSGFRGGVMATATGVGLLGDECLDLQLDVSSTARDRRFLTSIVMLLSNLGGIYGDWLLWWWRPCQEVVSFGLAPPLGVMGYQCRSR